MSNKRMTVLLIAGLAMFAEGTGFAMVIPILPTFAEQFELSDTYVGAFYATFGLISFFLYIPFGYLVDRFGERKTLLTGLLLLSLASVLYAFLMTYTPATMLGFSLLICCRAMQGIAAAAIYSSALPLAAKFSKNSTRGFEMNIVVLTAYGLGVTLGPALSGFGSISYAFAFFAIFPVILAVVAYLIVPDDASALKTGSKLGKRLASEYAFTSKDFSSSALAAYLVIAAAYSAISMLEVLMPLRLAELDWSRASIGTLFAIRGVTALIGQPLVGLWSDYRGRREPMVVGLASSCLLIPTLFFTLGTGYEYTVFLITVVCIMIAVGPTFPLIADSALAGREGKAFAFSNVAVASGFMCGPWIAGIFSDAWGPMAAPAFIAGLLFSVCIVVMRLLR